MLALIQTVLRLIMIPRVPTHASVFNMCLRPERVEAQGEVFESQTYGASQDSF